MEKRAWHEYMIKHPEGFSDAITGALFDAGCDGTTDEDGVMKAYFPLTAGTEEIDGILSAFTGVEFSRRTVHEQDWYAGWKAGMGPFSAAGLFICPPWKTQECSPGESEKLLLVDPGEAFGTGDHDTTVTVIGMLRDWVMRQDDPGGKSILDLGTGTGILSVAAHLYGVGNITAVDIEQKAVETAARNFALNGMVGKVRLMPGSIKDAGKGYDLILANLFQEVIVSLMPGMAAALNPGGSVILSGLLVGQEDKVLAVAEKYGLRQVEKDVVNGWVSLLLAQ